MEDLINKLQDLNRIDPFYNYNILILNNGGFILYGNPIYYDEQIRIECEDSQCLREKMYRIILNVRNESNRV